jgi:hypothetical protein
MTDHTKVESLAKKRRGMDLSALFHDPSDPRRKALVDSFAEQLTDYIQEFLNPDTEDHKVLWARGKAMGVIETLEDMGQTMEQIHEIAARAAHQKARVSLGI